MKKIIGFVLVALFISMSANAQAQKQQRMRKMSKLTVEQQAEMQTKHLVLTLDLTKDQEKKVFALKKEQAEKRKVQMEARQQNKENRADLTDDEKYQMRVDRLDRQIAHKAEMKKILNDDQYEKWEKIQVKKKRGIKKGMAKKGQSKGFKNRG